MGRAELEFHHRRARFGDDRRGQSLTLSPTAVPLRAERSATRGISTATEATTRRADPTQKRSTWSQLNGAGINDGPETFQMRLRVTNGRTTTTSNPSTLSITPVNPTATLNSGVAEGSPATVSFSNQFDPSPVETTTGFLYSYDFLNNGTFEVVNSKSAVSAVPASDLLTVGPHVVHARITEARANSPITIRPSTWLRVSRKLRSGRRSRRRCPASRCLS